MRDATVYQTTVYRTTIHRTTIHQNDNSSNDNSSNNNSSNWQLIEPTFYWTDSLSNWQFIEQQFIERQFIERQLTEPTVYRIKVDPGGAIGAIDPLKPKNVALFIMIFDVMVLMDQLQIYLLKSLKQKTTLIFWCKTFVIYMFCLS